MCPDKKLLLYDKSLEITFQIKFLSEHISITSPEHYFQINSSSLFLEANALKEISKKKTRNICEKQNTYFIDSFCASNYGVNVVERR